MRASRMIAVAVGVFGLAAWATVPLELVKDDWLSGKMTLTGGSRGSTSSDRPVSLERKT